jgi:hypothetical protein
MRPSAVASRSWQHRPCELSPPSRPALAPTSLPSPDTSRGVLSPFCGMAQNSVGGICWRTIPMVAPREEDVRRVFRAMGTGWFVIHSMQRRSAATEPLLALTSVRNFSKNERHCGRIQNVHVHQT